MDFYPEPPQPDRKRQNLRDHGRKRQEPALDLQWAEPWNGVATDLDAFLLDSEANRAKSSERPKIALRCPGRRQRRQFPATGRGPLLGKQTGPTGSPAGHQPASNLHPAASSATPPAQVRPAARTAAASARPSTRNRAAATSSARRSSATPAPRRDRRRRRPLQRRPKPERYSSRGPVTHYFGPVTGAFRGSGNHAAGHLQARPRGHRLWGDDLLRLAWKPASGASAAPRRRRRTPPRSPPWCGRPTPAPAPRRCAPTWPRPPCRSAASAPKRSAPGWSTPTARSAAGPAADDRDHQAAAAARPQPPADDRVRRQPPGRLQLPDRRRRPAALRFPLRLPGAAAGRPPRGRRQRGRRRRSRRQQRRRLLRRRHQGAADRHRQAPAEAGPHPPPRRARGLPLPLERGPGEVRLQGRPRPAAFLRAQVLPPLRRRQAHGPGQGQRRRRQRRPIPGRLSLPGQAPGLTSRSPSSAWRRTIQLPIAISASSAATVPRTSGSVSFSPSSLVPK